MWLWENVKIGFKLFFSPLVKEWTESSYFNITLSPNYYEKISAAYMKISGILFLLGLVLIIASFFTTLTLGDGIVWIVVSMFLDMLGHHAYHTYLLQTQAAGVQVYSVVKDDESTDEHEETSV